MPVVKHKTLGLTQILEYLGLVLNFMLQTIQIPENKRVKCLALINSLLMAKGKKVTVKMIQNTAGSLNFICQAIPAGKPFLQSLYRLTRNNDGGRAKAGHHRRLNKETLADLEMFRSFLLEYADPFVNSIPFLNRVKRNWSDIELFADSAGGEHLGLGLYFRGQWHRGLWSKTQLFQGDFHPNIALLELYAIVLAVAVWKEEVKGQSIVLRSDSEATCFFINKMKADIPAAMQLLRHLTKTCLLFHIYVTAHHIERVKNVNCDLISRNQLQLFFKRNPNVSREIRPLPQLLWPPQWTQTEMMRYSLNMDTIEGNFGLRNEQLSSDNERTDNANKEHAHTQSTAPKFTIVSMPENQNSTQHDNWDRILENRIQDNESVISFELDDPLFAASQSTVLSPRYSPIESNQIEITASAIDEACKAALDHLKRLNSEDSDEQNNLKNDHTYTPEVEDGGVESDSTENGAESDYYKDIESAGRTRRMARYQTSNPYSISHQF